MFEVSFFVCLLQGVGFDCGTRWAKSKGQQNKYHSCLLGEFLSLKHRHIGLFSNFLIHVINLVGFSYLASLIHIGVTRGIDSYAKISLLYGLKELKSSDELTSV